MVTVIENRISKSDYRKPKIRIAAIVFLYTYKCNFQCKHCCISASPTKTEKLEPAAANKMIDQASPLGIAHVAFSGGEPLLYIDEILKLIKRARKNSMSSSVVTNGFWGATKKSATSKVSLLKDAGLTTLKISYDKFHTYVGVKIQWIENIIAECKKQGIEVEIRVVKGPAKDENYRRIQRDLRNFEQFDCKLNLSELAPYGAASENFPPSEYRYSKIPIEKLLECEGFGTLACTANGVLMPCCALPIVDIETKHNCNLIRLGNIYEDKLEACIERLENNLYLSILAILGPVGFKLLAQEYANHINLPETLLSTCDFCVFAAGSNEFRAWLSELEKDKTEIWSRLRECSKLLNRWGIAHNTNIVWK